MYDPFNLNVVSDNTCTINNFPAETIGFGIFGLIKSANGKLEDVCPEGIFNTLKPSTWKVSLIIKIPNANTELLKEKLTFLLDNYYGNF